MSEIGFVRVRELGFSVIDFESAMAMFREFLYLRFSQGVSTPVSIFTLITKDVLTTFAR